jgi:uncharacterized membrane protein
MMLRSSDMRFSFRRTFLAGLFIVLPILVTLWILGFFFGLADSMVKPLLMHFAELMGFGGWFRQAWVDLVSPIASLSLAVLAIFVIGLVGGNVMGKSVLKWLEQLLMRIPLVRGIYSSTRQFVNTFSASSGKSFSRVVLVEFPRAGSWTLGFVTSNASGEIGSRIGRDMLAIFVPTTPNPTGGYLIYVNEREVRMLDMSVDDAFKLIISGGVLTPEVSQVEAAPTRAAS